MFKDLQKPMWVATRITLALMVVLGLTSCVVLVKMNIGSDIKTSQRGIKSDIGQTYEADVKEKESRRKLK